MADFTLTAAVLEHITFTTVKHLRELNDELTEAYNDHPDEACTVAIATAIATTLASFRAADPAADVLRGVNETLIQLNQPWRLVSLNRMRKKPSPDAASI